MKKAFVLLIVLFVATNLNAQIGVEVGPKVGYQASKLSFKKSDIEVSLRNDMNVGFFTRFSFRKFIIQPEVVYSFQDASHKVNNLSVPVLLGLKIIDKRNLKMS